jgi:hypothetical protein
MTQIRAAWCFQVWGPAVVEANEERQLQMLDVYPGSHGADLAAATA